MQITLAPIRTEPTVLQVSRAGDTLVINGQTLDFAAISEGCDQPAQQWDCPFLVGEIRRDGGVLFLTLLCPHGPDAGPETLFPAPIDDPADGEIPLPPYSRDRMA